MAPAIIISIFSFLVLANYLIHIYYKNKRKLLLAAIGNKDFIELKNIRIEFYSIYKTYSRWKVFTSDIILFENTLIILLRNYHLRSLINLNQSIIQIFKKENNGKKPLGVGSTYTAEEIKFTGNKIYFYSSVVETAKIEIILEFDQIEKLNIVKEYI